MKRILSCALGALSFAMPAFAQVPAQPAETGLSQLWQVCNETSYVLRMAVATKQGETLSAKGWERLRPGACAEINAAVNVPRYVYAESSAAYQGGIREWQGGTPFCVGENDFEVSGDVGCAVSGYEARNFLAVDANEFVTKFVEPDNFSRRAETAGLQRLLKENGYRMSRIDGVPGRRTSRTLARFIKDKRLAANLATDQKIDALEKAAINRIENLGVKVCNKSSQRIWVAVAKRLNDNWESRGWWPAETGTCIHPETQALKLTQAHVFARQEQPGTEETPIVPDKHLRSDAATPAQFCISESKFSARGRMDCTGQGYEAASFRVLPADKDGVVVNLSDSDFAVVSRAGLRR